MLYKDIPEDIIEFFEESERPTTPYTDALEFIFKNLIKEYFIAVDVSMKEKNIDYIPKRFNTSRSNYTRLAIKITEESEKPIDFIQDSFLKNLCFPEKHQERNRENLIVIYTWINKFLSGKKTIGGRPARDGKYWVEEWKKNSKSENEPNIEITLPKIWHASTGYSAPQWCDFLKIPLNNSLIRRVSCLVKSNAETYRFGFKLFRNNGKVFGDGSIQSMDNNLLIHYGKNSLSDELFITIYRNGIRQRPDIYIKQKQSKDGAHVELFVNDENFLIFSVNRKEVHRVVINQEIKEQVYMMAWSDRDEFLVDVEDIEIETISQ